MPRLPGIGLGLAGLAVFVLALLALVQGQDITLTQPGDTPSEETTVADGDGTTDDGQDTQQDPESIVRVHPDKVVIQGKKEGLRDVTYDRVPLTAWLSDLSAGGQTTDDQNTDTPEPPGLSWSPVSAGDGSVPLTVEEITNPTADTGGPCEGVRSIPEGGDPPCYKVGLQRPQRLAAGTYGATIYVGDDLDGRRAIPVEVLVGRPLLWLIGVVAAGVLATELVVWWREGAAQRYGWRVRRARWIDWLSENLDWTRPYEDDVERDDVERTALRTVKESLREKLNGLRAWLDRGAKGGTTIAQVPANQDAAKDMVYPLRSELELYLTGPHTRWEGRLDHLEEHLPVLGGEAVSQATTDLEKAYGVRPRVPWDPKRSSVATAYNKLDERWDSRPEITEKKLAEAWVTIKALWKRAEELWNEAPKLPQLPPGATVPADIEEAAEALSGYLSKLRADVFSKARESLDTVKDVAPAVPGQPQTVDFLTKVVERVRVLELAELAVDRAKHPLKFAEANSEVAQDLESLKVDLRALDEQIVATSSGDLTKDAVRAAILKPVREQLESAEARFYDPSQDVKKLWPEVRLTYRKNSHFIRLGERIARNRTLVENPPQNDLPQTFVDDAKRCLKNAYRFLLDGKALDAEIELERAEEGIQRAYTQRGKNATWMGRFSIMLGDLHQPARQMWEMFKRIIYLVSFMLLIMTALTFVLVVSIWILSLLIFIGVDIIVQAIPDSSYLDGPLRTIRWAVRYVWDHPIWSGLFLAILILIVAQYLRYRRPRRPAAVAGFRDRLENIWPFTVRIFLGIVSGLLSLVIAVTVILAYQQTVPKEQMATWGTNLDLVIAFALGVLAHGIVQSLRSASEDLMSFLKGEEKPSTEAGKEEEKKDSAATTPAKAGG